jgi:hypothetical protein
LAEIDDEHLEGFNRPQVRKPPTALWSAQRLSRTATLLSQAEMHPD